MSKVGQAYRQALVRRAHHRVTGRGFPPEPCRLYSTVCVSTALCGCIASFRALVQGDGLDPVVLGRAFRRVCRCSKSADWDGLSAFCLGLDLGGERIRADWLAKQDARCSRRPVALGPLAALTRAPLTEANLLDGVYGNRNCPSYPRERNDSKYCSRRNVSTDGPAAGNACLVSGGALWSPLAFPVDCFLGAWLDVQPGFVVK